MKMNFIAAMSVCCAAAVASVAVCRESPKSLANQLMDRTNSIYKIGKEIPASYAPSSELLVTAAEIQQLCTKARYLSDPESSDVKKLRAKLATLKTINADVAELAEEDNDEATLQRTKSIETLIRKMSVLSKRLQSDELED